MDGAVRCGHLLRDAGLLRKSLRQVNYVLDHASEDGYLGPPHLKEPVRLNRWVHAVFFRALMAHHSGARDGRIPAALRAHYLSGTSPHVEDREVCNIEAMAWAYEKTGDRRLLAHALESLKGYNRLNRASPLTLKNMLSARKAHCHGVTYMEKAKLPAILYMHTGEKRLLKASVNAFRKLERHHMLVSGVPSSSEYLTGRTSLDSHETCDISDFTWSAGYLLMATGNPRYADMIERACLNAGTGAVRKDFKALQYLSCPNQALATAKSDHNPFQKGADWMAFIPDSEVQCCAGNVHRFMPNYAARSWMGTPGGGLAAVLYAPGRVTAAVGPGRVPVTIEEDTRYPFCGRVDLTIHTKRRVRFPLLLRIPGWCGHTQILVNGRRLRTPARPGTFVAIRRNFSDSDRITLLMPMELKLNRRPENGFSVEFGPLVYSLLIKENWRPRSKAGRDPKRFPAWDLTPGSAWNYALALKGRKLAEAVKISLNPFSDTPWNPGEAPVALEVPARRIRGWKTRKCTSVMRGYPWANSGREAWASPKKVNGRFEFTPPLPRRIPLSRLSDKIETVTLVPYGATHLRITTFPICR